MSNPQDPTKPQPDSEKFRPQNVAKGGPDKGRYEGDMKDVARGSEGDRRRAAQDRGSGKNS